MADSSNVVWQVHLSLTWTEPEDPVTVKFIQSDRLVEAAAVNVHGSSVTLKKQTKEEPWKTIKGTRAFDHVQIFKFLFILY